MGGEGGGEKGKESFEAKKFTIQNASLAKRAFPIKHSCHQNGLHVADFFSDKKSNKSGGIHVPGDRVGNGNFPTGKFTKKCYIFLVLAQNSTKFNDCVVDFIGKRKIFY